MSRTNGHTVRRYEGEKLYYAGIAQRKAALVADRGLDLDVPAFYDVTEPEPCRCAACGVSLDVGDVWYAELMEDARERDMALAAYLEGPMMGTFDDPHVYV